VIGSQRVFEAAAQAGVRTVVHASSVGAYAAGPKDRRVDESWPTTGIPTSFYSRHKAAVERILDAFEATHPHVRVVRLRPGLIFMGEAASEIRRLFAGPFLPRALVRRGDHRDARPCDRRVRRAGDLVTAPGLPSDVFVDGLE
jgi:nucleoside-diphosphate-sugar epimerase